jgi:GNAT superfamily N-acetyltransferase
MVFHTFGSGARRPLCPRLRASASSSAMVPADAVEDPERIASEGGTPVEDALPKLERQQTSLAEHAPVSVVVGTSALANSDFVRECTRMVNTSYGYRRVSEDEIVSRLAMGDEGPEANRVLHVATRAGVLVGCCSSTRQTPWCPYGCGHWGLLVVDVKAQGTGVASALVAAAERRLCELGLTHVQIEYDYTPGDPKSERLYAWYEGSCGFSGGGPPSSSHSSFRRCRKRLDAPPGQRSARRHLRCPTPTPSGTHSGAEESQSAGGWLEWARRHVRDVIRRSTRLPT